MSDNMNMWRGCNMALRLSPVWVCIAVHCSGGTWPTPLEAALRVLDYGFSVERFKEAPLVALTHIFVHATDEHLIGNMFSLMSVLCEFGGKSFVDNVYETDMRKSAMRTLGTFVVLIVGGMVGGLGGQICYNDAQRTRRYEEWVTSIENRMAERKRGSTPAQAHAMDEASSLVGAVARFVGRFLPIGAATAGQNGLADNSVSSGGGGSMSLKSTLANATDSVRLWMANVSNKIEKCRNESMFMCGASAGICAISGFNAAYYRRWYSGIMMVGPEILAVAQSLVSDAAPHVVLSGGGVVGHAAHVGGFAAGLIMGILWRRYEKYMDEQANEQKKNVQRNE